MSLLAGVVVALRDSHATFQTIKARADQHLERRRLLSNLWARLAYAQSMEFTYLLSGDRLDLERHRQALAQLEEANRAIVVQFGRPDAGQAERDLAGVPGQRIAEMRRRLTGYEREGVTGRARANALLAGRQARESVRPLLLAARSAEEADQALADQEWRQALAASERLTGLLLALNAVLAVGITFAWLRNVRDRQASESRLEHLVDQRTAELSALSAHLQTVTEETCTRVARELHDELGGLLIAANLQLAAVAKLLPQDAGPAREKLKVAHELLTEGVKLKRRIVEGLRPTILEHLGLVSALRWYAEDVAERACLKITTDLPAEDLPLRQEHAIGLFRIAQEALTNVVRHARATEITLAFAQEDGTLRLEVRDDGIGFQPDAARIGSHGLGGLRQRARSLGGEIRLDSAPGRGTRLVVTVPYVPGEAAPGEIAGTDA